MFVGTLSENAVNTIDRFLQALRSVLQTSANGLYWVEEEKSIRFDSLNKFWHFRRLNFQFYCRRQLTTAQMRMVTTAIEKNFILNLNVWALSSCASQILFNSSKFNCFFINILHLAASANFNLLFVDLNWVIYANRNCQRNFFVNVTNTS